MPVITAIINLHNEGRLCQPTIQSVLRAATQAQGDGFSCETLVVIDRGDAATLDVVSRFSKLVRIEHCDHGDLGAARNFGTSEARGQHIAFMDGDDLMGSHWLSIAARTVAREMNREVVVHPRVNYVFGDNLAPLFWVHPDMDEDRIDLEFLRGANLWTALSFARVEIYRKYPYGRNEFEKGFGYEDWCWNLETVEAGVTHLAPPGTIHFVRRKEAGSLRDLSRGRRIIPNLPRRALRPFVPAPT